MFVLLQIYKTNIMRYLIILFTILSVLCNCRETNAQGKIIRGKTETTQSKPSSPKQSVKPKETRGYLNGHEWVDLGLPSGTKWATMNIGAIRQTDEGTYYAWGETSIPSIKEEWYDGTIVPNYSPESCRLFGKNIGSISGTSYDVARTKWGDGWILPEKKDIEELAKYCDLEVVNFSGVDGYKITGPNGNYIFFPCTAVCSGHLKPFKSIDTYSCYWIGSEYSANMGCVLSLDRMDIKTGSANSKNVGYAVRAITRK